MGMQENELKNWTGIIAEAGTTMDFSRRKRSGEIFIDERMNDVCVEYLLLVKSYFSENEAFTNRLYNLAIQVLKKNQKYGSLGHW